MFIPNSPSPPSGIAVSVWVGLLKEVSFSSSKPKIVSHCPQHRLPAAVTVPYSRAPEIPMLASKADSPVGTKWDAYEYVLLIAAHSERHSKQINEVKGDPNFPKN